MPTRTSVAPYLAVTDRTAYPLPQLPAFGPAGSVITDPTFGSTITRVTDANTRTNKVASFRTPSSPNAMAWSADGKHFYVTSTDGTILVFDVDPTTGAALLAAHQPAFYAEPQFSYAQPGLLWGARDPAAHTIEGFSVSAGTYTTLLTLPPSGHDLTNTYAGYLTSSETDLVGVLYGGTGQDLHMLVVVCDAAGTVKHLLDTLASTLDGQPTPIPLNYRLHHICFDHTGRFLNLYPTGADQASTRHAPQSVVWDLQAGAFTEVPTTAYPYGHEALGHAVSVNQDSDDPWDACQWQIRASLTPLVRRSLLPTVLQPKEVYIDGHATWNHATADNAMPFITELYQYGAAVGGGVWRAWDNEIIAVQVNAPAGQDPTVWRFCHHRSTQSNDFWSQPRVNSSKDGRWCLFTSNWENTLGTDPNGGAMGTGGPRQDVFLLKLDPATPTTAPSYDHALSLLEQGNALVTQGIAELKAWRG